MNAKDLDSSFPHPPGGFSHLLGAEQDVGRADNEPPTLARAEGSLLCCSSRVFPNKTLIKPIREAGDDDV